LESIIHDIERLLGARAGSICLGQSGDEQGYRIATTRAVEDACPGNYQRACTLCLDKAEPQCFQVGHEAIGRVQVVSTPIRDKKSQHGILLMEFAAETSLEPWQQRLLETVAQHITLAINVSQQVAQHRMLALLEERSVIARELHDSLAQSLSYLKIQVSRLEKRLLEAAPQSDVLVVSQGLRSGLNGAYRQLRELLTTFRLRIHEEDLGAALEATVKEYAQRGDMPIEFSNRLVNCRLSANAEIHVIQIVREALSNVLRHANASCARVCLDCDTAGRVQILVEDNGTGMREYNDMLHHYGMPIMRERAARLGGSLQVTESRGGGTRVELTFSLSDADPIDSHQGGMQELSDG
jgi:two-component system nitrate/nitrite sensor histidine kinase NarX